MTRPTEDELIARYLAPLAGPGGLGLRDDAALATPRPGHDLVVTKDMLVAGVHFFPDDPPAIIARKALRVNLSDLAAKAAVPTGVLLGLALPHDWTEPWLAAFCTGLADDLRGFACPLLGGDTTATPGPLTISITAFGEVAVGRMVPRTGARAGDALFVTGTIGDAALGLRICFAEPEDAGWIAGLDPAARAALVGRHRRPEPRLQMRDALRDHAHAAMDVSDGLLGDLGKMLRLENLTATLALPDIPLSPAARGLVAAHPRLWEHVLADGDDYEILCAVPPDEADSFASAAAAAGVPVARIGIATSGEGPMQVRDGNGALLDLARHSFQHFA